MYFEMTLKEAQSLLGRKCFPIEFDFLEEHEAELESTFTIVEVSLGANDVPKFKILDYFVHYYSLIV
jgi:hypothetical protein